MASGPVLQRGLAGEPTGAVIRLAATCVCGSDLWPYRRAEPIHGPSPICHEYVEIVEEVGTCVKTVKPGQFVVGGFSASDNTCEICRAGYQTSCVQREWMNSMGAQAEWLRAPLADAMLVATPDTPDDDLIPNLLTASDVLATVKAAGPTREPFRTRAGIPVADSFGSLPPLYTYTDYCGSGRDHAVRCFKYGGGLPTVAGDNRSEGVPGRQKAPS